MIRRAYEKLFVAFYEWSLTVDGKKGVYNVHYATNMLSLSIALNCASVLMFIDLLAPYPFLPHLTGISKTWLVLGLIAYLLLQHLYFRHGDRYRVILLAHGVTEHNVAKKSNRKLIAYMVISIITVIGLMILQLK